MADGGNAGGSDRRELPAGTGEFSGYNRPYEKHGNKYIVTAPGFMLKFDSILEERNEDGDLLRIVQKDDVTGARVESVMQFYDGLPVARMYNTVTNEGSENQTLEYISSFSYWGIEKSRKRAFRSLSAQMIRCR